jgi:hypothetical protein
MAMAPAITNESQTAAPATSPAAPRNAKIPAPTIEPTPMTAACLTVSRWGTGSLMATSQSRLLASWGRPSRNALDIPGDRVRPALFAVPSQAVSCWPGPSWGLSARSGGSTRALLTTRGGQVCLHRNSPPLPCEGQDRWRRSRPLVLPPALQWTWRAPNSTTCATACAILRSTCNWTKVVRCRTYLPRRRLDYGAMSGHTTVIILTMFGQPAAISG